MIRLDTWAARLGQPRLRQWLGVALCHGWLATSPLALAADSPEPAATPCTEAAPSVCGLALAIKPHGRGSQRCFEVIIANRGKQPIDIEPFTAARKKPWPQSAAPKGIHARLLNQDGSIVAADNGNPEGYQTNLALVSSLDIPPPEPMKRQLRPGERIASTFKLHTLLAGLETAMNVRGIDDYAAQVRACLPVFVGDGETRKICVESQPF